MCSFFCFLFITNIVGLVYSQSVPFDVAYCFEDGECKIKSVGSFSLDNETSEIKMTGHIFEITNGLFYDAYFYWDAIGTPSSTSFPQSNKTSPPSPPINPQLTTKNSIFIPSGTVRYFDSTIYGAHIVRLFVKIASSSSGSPSSGDVFESVDKAIGREEDSVDKRATICDYLFRICYLDEKYRDMAGENHKTRCIEYTNMCKSFYKKNDDDICIDTCITTFYGHLLNDKEKISPSFDRTEMVQCIIENQRKVTGIYSGENLNVNKASSSSYTQRLETTITVLAVLLVIFVVFDIICVFFWARHRYLSRNAEISERLNTSIQDEDELTLRTEKKLKNPKTTGSILAGDVYF